MTKKLLMVVLFLAFISGFILLFLFLNKRVPGVSVTLPLPKTTPVPTALPLLPTPTVIPQFSELEKDFLLIEQDIEKLKKEDIRLEPPNFIFDLGLK